nr:PAS domain-containing protein [Bacillota bacterium]
SVLDSNLNIMKVNRWMEKMYSTKAPLVGKKCYEVYQQRDSPCPFCPSLPAIKTGELQTTVVPYPLEKEPTGWIELSAFPLKDANGDVVGVIEYVKDITERRRAEEALEHLNLTLKAIRNVNQLITHEQDREELVRRACELLTF